LGQILFGIHNVLILVFKFLGHNFYFLTVNNHYSVNITQKAETSKENPNFF